MNDLNLFAEKIKGFKSVYLAGGIQLKEKNTRAKLIVFLTLKE